MPPLYSQPAQNALKNHEVQKNDKLFMFLQINLLKERHQLLAKELKTWLERQACSARQMTSLLSSSNPTLCNFIQFSAFKYLCLTKFLTGKKTHLTLQLCCLGLQSCQVATKRKAQLTLILGKEDFLGTVKSNTDDSVNSKLLSNPVATHTWYHWQAFAAAAGLLLDRQNSDVNNFYSLSAP